MQKFKLAERSEVISNNCNVRITANVPMLLKINLVFFYACLEI